MIHELMFGVTEQKETQQQKNFVFPASDWTFGFIHHLHYHDDWTVLN